jgi:nicotinamidase-related amidase
MGENTALMIIDVQVGMFSNADEVLFNGEWVLQNIRTLLQNARSSGTPVIFIQHTVDGDDEYERGKPTWEIHSAIKPIKGDDIVEKSTWDSFYKTNLEAVLKRKGITNLVICGMQSEFCLDTTCRRAFSMEYKSILVSDAHTTFDSEFLKAEQIIRHHNRVLGGRFVELKRTEEIDFSGGINND